MYVLCNSCQKVTEISNSQGCEQDQKNTFRTEDSIESLIGTKFLDHRTLIDHNWHK
jgi:hypothetical protein